MYDYILPVHVAGVGPTPPRGGGLQAFRMRENPSDSIVEAGDRPKRAERIQGLHPEEARRENS